GSEPDSRAALAHVPGAERQPQRPGPRDVKQVLRRPRAAAADVRHVAVAVGADRPGQLLGADAGDRLLTRRVDVQDDEDVGLVEGGEELLAQVMSARIPMRLKYGDEPTLEASAGGGQRRAAVGGR